MYLCRYTCKGQRAICGNCFSSVVWGRDSGCQAWQQASDPLNQLTSSRHVHSCVHVCVHAYKTQRRRQRGCEEAGQSVPLAEGRAWWYCRPCGSSPQHSACWEETTGSGIPAGEESMRSQEGLQTTGHQTLTDSERFLCSLGSPLAAPGQRTPRKRNWVHRQ